MTGKTVAQPVIRSISPLHGVVNSRLTIRGTGLKPSSGSPVVRFGVCISLGAIDHRYRGRRAGAGSGGVTVP